MDANKVLLGAFVGVLSIAMFTPVLTLYGFNHTTSLVLLYILPVVGALSVAVAESVSFGALPGKKTVDTAANNAAMGLSGIVGKGVVLHTNMGGVYKGVVKDIDNSMVMLGKSTRLDLPESNQLDHLFIEKTDIKRMEISDDTQETTPVF